MTRSDQTQGDGSRGSGNTKRLSRLGGLVAEVKEIQDSRGRPTVRVVLRLGDAEGIGDVPAGASKGADEARTVAIPDAIKNIEKVIVPMIRATDADLRRHESLLEIEASVVERAGSNYEELGANAVVPVSRALWQLVAALRDSTLYEYLRRHEPSLASNDRVNLFMNVFNGGLHALRSDEQLGRDRIDIQEIMIVPVGATNYREALAMGDRVDASLKDLLVRTYGEERVSRGDEAGFTVAGLGDSGIAIAHVIEAVERSGYIPGEEVKLALDVAASSLFDRETNRYRLQGQSLSTEQMIAFLGELADRYAGRLMSIEDGLDEEDWDGWGTLSAAMKDRGVLTIGDDLFVTQMRRLRRGVNNDSAHAILVKVNQNGSVGGTLEVIRYARQNGMQCVISHRSGETTDDSIADLAAATGALGLKAGDPQPESDYPDPATWVRRRKYLRLVQLEESGRL